MSELIKNRDYRKKKLKEIIKSLHNGASVDDVKREFEQLTINVSPSEITEMEQALVDEGLDVSEIQRLCDVHASVFKESLDDIHDKNLILKDLSENHPIEVFKRENRKIEDLIDQILNIRISKDSIAIIETLLDQLKDIDLHFKRKENLIFPYMESNGITAPPQVMWGVDDEIRDKLNSLINNVCTDDLKAFETELSSLANQIKEMIFKEEEIMIPMLKDIIEEKDWKSIESASLEIGYALIDAPKPYIFTGEAEDISLHPNGDSTDYIGVDSKAKISFDAGMLTAEEINSILNTVPIDMTFVGADNRVKYFTQGKERIFTRPISIVGREVKYCHPPKSVHIVEQIVEDLKSGKKDHEDFWIRLGEDFVYIRYFAVRSKANEFLGVLEVSQNIKPITELEGEKRLMS